MAQVCDVRTAESKAAGSPRGDRGAGACPQGALPGPVPVSLSPSQVFCSQADSLLGRFAMWALGILPTPSNAECRAPVIKTEVECERLGAGCPAGPGGMRDWPLM